jgi:RNA polymerase sigma-70 factor (ECF subfamily)
VTDTRWINAVITSARPRVVAALLRHFRNLDMAEEACQEACLRALRLWPSQGPPRDAAAWLIMVGRNAGIDSVRRVRREQPLPPEDAISDLSDVEATTVEHLDAADYRDDILRLLFVCCHPELPATQQIALALRIVSGLSVAQIARVPGHRGRHGAAHHAGEAPHRRCRRAVRDARRGRAQRTHCCRCRRDLPAFQRGLHE